MLGEDARKIDWKSMAKTGTPHVKLFFEEREVSVVLVALLSGSLLFKNKKEKLLKTCASLGYGTLKLSNKLTPMIYDTKVTTYPSSKKLHSIEHFIKEVEKVELYKKEVDFKNLSNVLHPKIRQKSLLILVGDFLGDVNLSLLANRHEIVVVIIRSSFEENPQALGDGEFTDPQTAESASFYFGKSARDAYAKRYEQNDAKLLKHLRLLGISYVKVVSD
jgi:uncharacterized protein (DUF58 family)